MKWLSKLKPVAVGLAVFALLGAAFWNQFGAEFWDSRATEDGPVHHLELNSASLGTEGLWAFTSCVLDSDCEDRKACRHGACRRPIASVSQGDTCEFNDECQHGRGCLDLSCQALGRVRTGPGTHPTGDDWPQFRGPGRDAKSHAAGLARTWPVGGPPLLWKSSILGRGFGHPSIANGVVYTTGLFNKEGRLTALDLDGRVLWQTAYGAEWRAGGPPGARQSTTVDAGQVFFTSGHGVLYAFDANTGRKQWQVSLFAGDEPFLPRNGYADAPLVLGQSVVVLVGSSRAAAMAVDRRSGEILWSTPGGSLRHGYGALVAGDLKDRPVVFGLMNEGTVAIDANSGTLLWVDRIPESTPNSSGIVPEHVFACPPIFEDGQLFRTLVLDEGSEGGARMIRVDESEHGPVAIWKNPHFGIYVGGAVAVGGVLFGTSAIRFPEFSSSPGEEKPEVALKAVDWATGRESFALPFTHVGESSLMAANGLLFAYGDRGVVALVETNINRPALVGSFSVDFGEAEHMNYPALADGALYIRHGSVMSVYDVRESSPSR